MKNKPTPGPYVRAGHLIVGQGGVPVAEISSYNPSAVEANAALLLSALNADPVKYITTLIEIRDKWMPAIYGDINEPDKVLCYLGQIKYLMALAIPIFAFPYTSEKKPANKGDKNA
jgi:hypothetical protein